MSDVTLNEWEQLKYHDPRHVLLELRKIEQFIIGKTIDEKVRTMRTSKLKRHREGREGALFTYGLQESVIGIPIQFALVEAADYDIVTVRREGDTRCYSPVQIKELVPSHLNPNTTLNEEILKLKKYSNSPDLVVALHANRTERLNFNDIFLPPLNLSQLWIFGAILPDQSKWFLYGDLIKEPNYYEFSYPTN